MKISTEIFSASKLVGEHKAVELCARAGFDGWDFSLFGTCYWGKGIYADTDHPLTTSQYLAFSRELKKIGLDNGIVCNQSHAPFPSRDPQVQSFLKRAIECTAEAGGQICVIHPDNDGSVEENAQMYLELLPFAKDCGVKIATENMYNWDREAKCSLFAACATAQSFCDHLDAVNDEFLVACLDIGHAEMKGSGDGAVNMIHALGSKLQALHIQDCDLRNDSHQIPFSMNVDFPAVVKALKESGYTGWFTLEANSYLQSFDAATALTGVQDLANSARKLVQIWDSLS